MITTTSWVRRGVAAQFPTKYDIDEKEMDRISKLARMQLEEAKEDLSAAQADEDTAMDEDDKHDDAMEDDSEKPASKEGVESKNTEYESVRFRFFGILGLCVPSADFAIVLDLRNQSRCTRRQEVPIRVHRDPISRLQGYLLLK